MDLETRSTSASQDQDLDDEEVITCVRRANEKDIESLKSFLSNLTEKERIYQDFLESLDESTLSSSSGSGVSAVRSYVAEMENYETPLIGLIGISTEKESPSYAVNYDLEKYTYSSAHDKNSHGYVHYLIMNPIFQRHSTPFLKEVMRLDQKDCLFHRIYPDYVNHNERLQHQSLLSNLEDWIALMPRKRIDYASLHMTEPYDDERQPPPYVQHTSNPYAVIHTAKKFVMEPKLVITERIVVVGASTTGLSCLEKLLSTSFRSFKKLTIIDPFGIPGTLPPDPVRNEFLSIRNSGNRLSYKSDSEWTVRSGLYLWVKVITGQVTSIVKDQKHVVVNFDSIVPYDRLVLTPGLQYQRLDCPTPEIEDPNFIRFKMNTDPENIQKFTRHTPRPKNVFTINSEAEAELAIRYFRTTDISIKNEKIVVFGAGLDVFACIKALLDLDVDAYSIVLIRPTSEVLDWEEKSCYSPNCTVLGPIMQELLDLGVTIYENYEFDHWDTCTFDEIAEKTHFKSTVEDQPEHLTLKSFALFCYRYKRVDDVIVSALTEAYILYRNGISIDATFKTTDPYVFAAGPATVYRKSFLADNHNHSFYQSEEVGHRLADFIVESLSPDLSSSSGNGKLESNSVIRFKRPLIRAAVFLGNWHYLFVRTPGAHWNCSSAAGGSREDVRVESCEGSDVTEIVTGSVDPNQDPLRKFFKIRLDARYRVINLECMSKSSFSFSNISSAYGQHEVSLNKLLLRLQYKEITCLYNHFSKSWFALFCVDEWTNFIQELRELYKNHYIDNGITILDFIRDFISCMDNPESLTMNPDLIRSVWRSSKLEELVSTKLVNFLSFHKLSLPMFANNSHVEDLLEERADSPLYHLNDKFRMQDN